MAEEVGRRVFISHSWHDQAAASEIYSLLRAANMDVWLDEASLVAGERMAPALEAALTESSVVLFLVGGGLADRQLDGLSAVLDRSRRDEVPRIIPVLLPGSDSEALPPALLTCQWLDLRDATSWDAQVRRMAAVLMLDLDSGEAADDEEVGDRLRESGDLGGAIRYYERAAASVAEARFGDTNLRVAALRRKTGVAKLDLGDFEAARRDFEAALAFDRHHFGDDHPAIAVDLGNLGGVLGAVGDRGAAVELFERALAISEQAYGADHPAVATALNNLASVRVDLGDPTAALALFERALAISEQAYGPDHPAVATALNNLASVQLDLGDPTAALALFERALAISQEAYGPDHPDALTARNNLASVYRAGGRVSEAASMLEQVAADSDRVLGPNHPNTLTARNNLASVYRTAGRRGDEPSRNGPQRTDLPPRGPRAEGD